MKTGTVKFYNVTKGYGFIVEDETNDEIFVHASGLKVTSLKQNDKVKFEIAQGKKGLNAVSVDLV